MSRKFSNEYIDRQIAKIDELHKNCMDSNLIVTPKCLMPTSPDDWYARPKLTDFERKEIRAYYQQLQNLSYVRGFWMGWTLREGLKEK